MAESDHQYSVVDSCYCIRVSGKPEIRFCQQNSNIIRECAEFVGSRLATGVMEVGLMSLTVNVLKINFWVSKLLVSIIVIIANYILSKLVVFKTKDK